MRFLCFGLIVAISLIGRLEVFAQLPQATLSWVFPPGARVGSTNEVTISGSDLDEPIGLLFSDSRLTASIKAGAVNQFQVAVPDDVSEGVVDVRFVGRFGVSNPRAFVVGRRPELIAASTNATPGGALTVPLETSVNGRIHPNTTAWFRFNARGGQRILIRVEARDLDSRLVPNIVVSDAAGRELAIARRREWLDFTAPAEGDFLVSVADQIYRGGDDYHFRLTLCTGPQIDFVQPSILRWGETNRVTVFGRNLPGGQPSAWNGADGKPLEQISVEIPAPLNEAKPYGSAEQIRKPAAASVFESAFTWRLAEAGGASNPFVFALTTNVVVTGEGEQLTEVTPPCEFSGIFPRRGQVSGVTFRASKGDVYWLELFADRLGFPSDPHGVVQRVRSTKGEQGETLYADVLELGDTETNLGEREFNTITRDAAAPFEAPETGVYRVLVRDLFNLGEGRPRYPYRLSVRRESPDFRLVSLPTPWPRVGEDRRVHVLPATLRRNQTAAFKVMAFRRDGFSGDIELTATNLPAGVSFVPGRIPAGQNTGTLLLTASSEGATMANVAITGNAVIGTNAVTRPGALTSVVWPVADFNNENATARINRDSIISVISAEVAPVSISAMDGKALEVSAEGKLAVPLSITRHGEFQAAFNLRPFGHGALDKAKETAVPEKATNVTVEINLADAKLPAGRHTIWVQGSVAGKYRNNPEALAMAEAELQAAEKTLASISEAEKPKAEERRKAAEAAKKAAEEKAKPRDVTVIVYSQPFVVNVLPGAKPEEKK